MARIERVELMMVDLKSKIDRSDAIQSFMSQETPIVRITDADGATGTGYSYTIGTGGPSVIALLEHTLAPLLIGFILGRMLEDNFSRSMQLYDGIAFIWERPMTLGLLILALVLIILPSYRARRARARQEGVADGD